MATKHDVLTEDEVAAFSVNRNVMDSLEQVVCGFPRLRREEINVLDWGCGRGRSVAKLREMGFNAFGVDVDERVMAKGFALFKNRGLAPEELLSAVSRTDRFPNGFFHLIFSEQVLEHVADLTPVISEQSRVTSANGLGLHRFPGTWNVWEGHLKMPLAHWLPKTVVRKYWIGMMLMLGFGPKTGWAGSQDKPFSERLDTFYRYLNEKTFYRDSRHVGQLFETHGFDCRCRVAGQGKRMRRLYPDLLVRNGFPRGSVTLHVVRRGSMASGDH